MSFAHTHTCDASPDQQPPALLSHTSQMSKSLLPNWFLHAHVCHFSKGLNELKKTITFSSIIRYLIMWLNDLDQIICVNNNDSISYANSRQFACLNMDGKVFFPSWAAAEPVSMTSRTVG